MVLQFNEAPDYASILERDYQKQNRGFENREAAEQANDRRRIQNAGVPLDLIQGIAQFSATAKQLKDKLDQDKLEKDEKNKWTDKTGLEIKEELDSISDAEEISLQVSGKYKRDGGDPLVANDMVKNSPMNASGLKDSLRSIESDRSNLTSLWVKSSFYDQYKNEPDTSQKAAILELWGRSVFHRHYRDGKVKYALLKEKLIPYIDRFKENKLVEANKQELDRTENEQKIKDITDITNAFSSTNPGDEIYLWMKREQGRFGGKISDSVRETNLMLLDLLKNRKITLQQYNQFTNHKIPNHSKKGSPIESIEEIWDKAFIGSDLEVAKAVKASLDLKDVEESNYLRDFKNDLEAQENERIKQGGTRFTEDEIVEYYKNNYDSSQGGPLTQQMINEWWTAEEAFDEEHDRVLNEREKLGIPISKKEANKFNDPDKRAYWSNKAISLNTSVPSEAHIQSAKNRIKAHSVKHNKLEGSPDPSTNETYVNNTEYGLLEYRRIYAEEIQTAPSANAAHLETMKRIKENIFEGNYDTPPTPSINAAKQRELTLQSATEAIKLNPDIINTGIIFGTEKILEEVRANPNEIHIFYKQLADRYSSNNKPVTADALQYAQLEIAHKLFGGSKPVKSELLEAYEKLDPSVQFLLSTHPTPAKVMRAKIEAFKDDGEITYDEIEFLLEELTELQQKEYPTPELKQTSMDSILGWDFVTTM